MEPLEPLNQPHQQKQRRPPEVEQCVEGADSCPSPLDSDWSTFDSQFALIPPPTPRARPAPSLLPRCLFPLPATSATLSSPPLSLFDLPEDVFFHIFEFLPPLSLLRLSARPPSHTLHRLIRSHAVFDLDLDRELLDAEVPGSSHPPSRSLLASREYYQPLIPLAARAAHLSLLTLSSFGPLLTDAVVQPVIDQHSSTLLSLSLSNNDLINPSLSSPSLTSLDLSRNRRLQCPHLHCPALVQLDLSRTFINDLDLEKTCEGLSHLRVLRLQSCKNVRMLPSRALLQVTIVDLSNTAVVDEAITRLVETAPQLSVLFINECSTLRSPSISSPTLTVLSLRSCEVMRPPTLHCPALTELDLSDTSMTDTALVSVLSSCQKLRVLSLRQCYQLSHPRLTRALPELVSLDLTMSGIQTEGVQAFMEKALGLQTLHAAMCTKVTEGLMAGGGPSVLPFLCDVNLRSTYLGDEDVAALLKAAPLISRLNLGMCINVTSLSTIAPSLQHLHVDYCGVTDASLSTLLSSHVPQLLSATFDHCEALVRPTVAHPRVEALHFVCCRSMDGLIIDCPSLTSLDLSSNHALSSVSLSPSSLSSIKRIVAHHLNPLTLHTLMEDLADRDVSILSHTIPPSIYPTRGVRTSHRPPPRRSTTPLSATLSPSNSTPSLHSPTPSPQSAFSSDAPTDPPPRSHPRPIRRESNDDPPPPLPHSPSRPVHTPSPVKSRYLDFSPKTRPQSHRHTSSLTAPSPPSLPLTPLTPPTRPRLSRSWGASTPSSPASELGGDAPFLSGEILPLPHPPNPAYLHPFPLSAIPPLSASTSPSSLSALLTSRPIPRSVLLNTSPLPSPLPSPLSPPSLSPLSHLPPPTRFDHRASSLSSVDTLPRFFLNSIEWFIAQSHITEIEQRLQGDEAGKVGRGRGAAAPVIAGAGVGLSSAVRWGLKKQLALLKARLKKEEKLLQEVAKQGAGEGGEGRRGVRKGSS